MHLRDLTEDLMGLIEDLGDLVGDLTVEVLRRLKGPIGISNRPTVFHLVCTYCPNMLKQTTIM